MQLLKLRSHDNIGKDMSDLINDTYSSTSQLHH